MKNTLVVKRYLYCLKIIITGLVCSHIISFIHVYISNKELYEKISVIHAANYIIIPNLIVLEKLKSLETAFYGGFFFSLTVGACLTIFSFAAAMVWIKIFSRNKFFLVFILFFWFTGLFLVNANGFSPFVSVHFIIVPVVVFILSLKWFPTSDKGSLSGKPKTKILIHVICIAALALMSTSRMNATTYSHIRDNILLSSKSGISLNNFYYSYTLFAAQVFKSLQQDMLKTCRISASSGVQVSEGVKQALIHHDYLIVNTDIPCDLELQYNKSSIQLAHKGKPVIEITQKEFLENPGKMLSLFSRKCDRYVFFRSFAFISLLMFSGLSCYLVLYLPFRIISLFFIGNYSKGFSGFLTAAICCFVAGVSLLYSWDAQAPASFEFDNLEQVLKSDRLETRVAALKYIHGKKMDIGKIGIPSQMPVSPIFLERYWLAKTLYWAQSSTSYDVNLVLLDDPQINVSYIAFDALGYRKSERSIRQILERLPSLKQWYIQLYAYKSLRRLEWRQTELR